MAKAKLFGAIVMSAQSIDLTIVNLRNLETVERVSAPVALGDRLFTEGGIDYDVVDEAVSALRGFQQLMTDDGVTDERVVASHTITDAENISYVRDQIYTKTGLTVHFMTVSEELMFRYQAAAAYLPNFRELIDEGTVLIQIGASSITLMVFQAGELTLTRELQLGPMQVAQKMAQLEHQVDTYEDVLADYLHSKLLDVWRLLPEKQFKQVILMGSKLTLLENLIPENKRALALSHADFNQRFDQVMTLSDQELEDQEQLPEMEVNEVAPTFLLLNELFDTMQIETVWVSNIKLLDGFVVHHAAETGQLKLNWDFNETMISAAKNLAKRYQVDQAHQKKVLTFAVQLFDRLRKIHGLGPRERLLLQLAAILQDTGLYLDANQHAFHSEYIIRASEVLGLDLTEQFAVAAIARYHSSRAPSAGLSHLSRLPLEARLTIAKLAAILRLADALDDSHRAKISKISVSIRKQTFTVTATANDDIELEKWTFSQKGTFFREVFGLQPILKRKGTL
ncbi:exopolyphosphatase [Loigolactobacillus backii]|uniref:Exopolyphosphatase n=1 Tax=Loigolactobacillus backii TaxID=375175 RepID=A0A192GYF7_9LACO|nr:exopolyphosphatase [Loigolactobacillus backii]ANK61554.1 exopolyphosphatase [Loigolactobacillus backii]ANK69248.1 exopolyphosphatase [Loigolactobacillus backii]MDA5388060.1 exopolyphosphatase [Loigolactobacillus backii]MDA5390555.1 exopolyphosphatase [Loigolactobacillus backii]